MQRLAPTYIGSWCINTEIFRSNFNLHLDHLFVHMLVYDKHLIWYQFESIYTIYIFCYPATSELMAVC